MARMDVAQAMAVAPATRVRGTIRVPGDKSISHRYALLAAIADGRTTIRHYAPGADCASTLTCLRALGVAIEHQAAENPDDSSLVVITGRGVRGLTPPSAPLDCGNSGSTMRILAGVVAGHAFSCTLSGDRSLSRRPMHRIIGPLSRMGARLDAAEGDRPPITIHGANLTGIDFIPEVPSAQVKSAVLLAGLQAQGRTRVTEAASTRDHTERALAAFGACVEKDGGSIQVEGGQRLRAFDVRVPGDISSAAFPAVAAAALKGSDVRIEGVGLNPSRTGFVDVLRRFGASIEAVVSEERQGEPVGAITVRHGSLAEVEILPPEVPGIIDELPALGALATFGGSLRVTGAGELRVKESDRISAFVNGLRALGADAEELPDGFHVRGGTPLSGGIVHAHDDHRLAMALAIAALGARSPVTIEGAHVVNVSYPGFFDDLERLRA
jgi:3-phosphoshikimate 1-carboxyvinyltransferase